MPGARTFKPISAGDLRFVGDIELVNEGKDTAGSPVTTYSVWAEGVRFGFADYRGNETVIASTILQVVTSYLVVRWRPGLEGALPGQMRIKQVVDGSVSPVLVDYYDIQSVVRDRTMRWALQLQCVRRDSAGYRSGSIDPPPSGP